jgi:hypothetical protein
MTQKEAEEILVAAGWVIYREQWSLRNWTSPNGRYGVDIWKDDAVEDHARSWRQRENKINFDLIPSEVLIPKVIADVLRHCS